MESFEKQKSSIQDIKKETISVEDESARQLLGEELAEKYKDGRSPSDVPENLSELVKNDTTAGEWLNDEIEEESKEKNVPGVHDVEIHYEEKDKGAEIEEVATEEKITEEKPKEEKEIVKPKANFMGGVLDDVALSEIERVEKEQQENIAPKAIEEEIESKEKTQAPGKRSLISGIIDTDALDEVYKAQEEQDKAFKAQAKEEIEPKNKTQAPGKRSLISGIINPDALDEVWKEQEAQEQALKASAESSDKSESWVKNMFDKEGKGQVSEEKSESWVKSMFDKEGKGQEEVVPAAIPKTESAEANIERNEWKSIRKEYKEHRVKVDDAREKFEKLADVYATAKQDSGLLAKFVDNSVLKGKHEQMLNAQKEYYALLEGLRGLRQQRIEYRAKKLAEGSPEEEKRNVSTYVGLHEMLLEKQVDNEAVMLERLKYQEGKTGESNSKLLRFAKNKWKWYVSQPRHKRILYGSILGGAIAGVAATGLGIPAAIAAGGAAAARRGVGGFFGAHAALATKRFADKGVEKLEERELQAQHKVFQDTSLLESSKKRQSIRNRARWGKRMATGQAAGAAMIAGGGITAAASSEALTGMVEAKVDAAVDAAKGFMGVEDAQDTIKSDVGIIESKQMDVSHMETRTDEVGSGQGGNVETAPEGLRTQEFISEEEAQRIAESAKKNVQEMIDGVPEEKVQPYNVRQFEEAKAHYEAKYGTATHRADGVERVIANVEEPLPSTEDMRVEDTHSATHRDDGVERVIANVEEPVSVEQILTDAEQPVPPETTERVIANVEEPIPAKTEDIKDILEKYMAPEVTEPEALKMEGVYESGSSVERELQQFLESNDWIKENYPDMTDQEVGAISHRIRLHLEDHPELEDEFKIQGGDWDKVLANDKYSFYIDKDFIENEIEEYLNTEHKAVPAETTESTASEVTQTSSVSQPETPEVEEVTNTPEAQKAPEFDDVQKKVAPPDDLPVYEEVNKPIEVNKSVAEESLGELRGEQSMEMAAFDKEIQKEQDAYFMRYEDWCEKYKTEISESNKPERALYDIEKREYEMKMKLEKKFGPIPNPSEARAIAQAASIDISNGLDVSNDNGVLKINGTIIPDHLKTDIATKYPEYLVNENKHGDWINPDAVEPAQNPEPISPPTFAEEIKGAEKLIHEQGADYYGEQTRATVETFFEDGKLETNMKPHVLSSWGPISHAKLQDILDGEGSIKYAIGDNPPITMGKSVEDLCKSVVVQLEKQIDFETFEKLRKENITLGDFVQKISEQTGSNNIV
jgi:hypothetical protein